MTELHEELLAIADELDQLAERALRPEVEDPLARLQQAAEEVGRASSGLMARPPRQRVLRRPESTATGSPFQPGMGLHRHIWRRYSWRLG